MDGSNELKDEAVTFASNSFLFGAFETFLQQCNP